MQISLSILALALSTVVSAFPNVPNSGDSIIAERDSGCDPNTAKAISARSYNPFSSANLFQPRATIHCANCAKIKRVKAEYKGACNPANSKGTKGAHNCPGKSYLCVQGGVATCYKSIANAAKLGLEGGECFL